eukprot:319174-Pleurochrysis_carterae.AAC.1
MSEVVKSPANLQMGVWPKTKAHAKMQPYSAVHRALHRPPSLASPPLTPKTAYCTVLCLLQAKLARTAPRAGAATATSI